MQGWSTYGMHASRGCTAVPIRYACIRAVRGWHKNHSSPQLVARRSQFVLVCATHDMTIVDQDAILDLCNERRQCASHTLAVKRCLGHLNRVAMGNHYNHHLQALVCIIASAQLVTLGASEAKAPTTDSHTHDGGPSSDSRSRPCHTNEIEGPSSGLTDSSNCTRDSLSHVTSTVSTCPYSAGTADNAGHDTMPMRLHSIMPGPALTEVQSAFEEKDLLDAVAHLLLGKIATEPQYSTLYADLCVDIDAKLTHSEEEEGCIRGMPSTEASPLYLVFSCEFFFPFSLFLFRESGFLLRTGHTGCLRCIGGFFEPPPPMCPTNTVSDKHFRSDYMNLGPNY